MAAGFVFTAIVNNFPTIVANFLSRLGAPYPDDDTLGFLLYYIVQYYGHVYKVMVGLSGVCPQNVLLIDAKLADAWADLQNICHTTKWWSVSSLVVLAVLLSIVWFIKKLYLVFKNLLKRLLSFILNYWAPHCICCGEKHHLIFCPNGGADLLRRAEYNDVSLEEPLTTGQLIVPGLVPKKLLTSQEYRGANDFQTGRANKVIPSLNDCMTASGTDRPAHPYKRDQFERRISQSVRASNPSCLPGKPQANAYKSMQSECVALLKVNTCDGRTAHYNTVHAALYDAQSRCGEYLGPYNGAASNLHLLIKRKRDENADCPEADRKKKRVKRVPKNKKKIKKEVIEYMDDDEDMEY